MMSSMKIIVTSLATLGYLMTGSSVRAAAVTNAVREGTTVRLSPSEIADLKQWVENAKQELSLLQDDVRRASLEKRRTDIVAEFQAIVNRSGHKENELLMRYTLNRALEIDELVAADPAPSELQSLVAFLDSTIDLAKSFYTDDQKYLEAIGRGDAPELQTPMAIFAYQYSEMLLQFSRTFLRPELEYKVTYKALGWLANDLNSPRNLLRIQFAETILRIARIQNKFPATPRGDDSAILRSIRELKWEHRERVVKNLLAINADIREALARAEAKKAEDEKLRLENERLSRMGEEERKAEMARSDSERRMLEGLSPEDRAIYSGWSRQSFPQPNSYPMKKEFAEFERLSGAEDSVALNGHIELFFSGHMNEFSLKEIVDLLKRLRDPSRSAGDMEDERVAERIVRKTIQTRLSPDALNPEWLAPMFARLPGQISNQLLLEYTLPKRIQYLTEKQLSIVFGTLKDPDRSAGDQEDEVVAFKIMNALIPFMGPFKAKRDNAVVSSGKNLDERLDTFMRLIPDLLPIVNRNSLLRAYFRTYKESLNSDQGSRLIANLRDPSRSAGDLEDEVIAAEIRDYFLKRLNGN